MDLQLLLQLGSSFAASSGSMTANPVRNLSVVGALSQTFSIPSVSGPAFQVYGYHIDHALPNVSKVSDGGLRSSVAASRSTAGFGEGYFDGSNSKHGQLLLLPYSASNSDKDRSAADKQECFIKTKGNHTMILSMGISCFLEETDCVVSPFSGAGLMQFHSSASTCLSAGTVSDVSFNSTSVEEPLEGGAVSSHGVSMQSTWAIVHSWEFEIGLLFSDPLCSNIILTSHTNLRVEIIVIYLALVRFLRLLLLLEMAQMDYLIICTTMRSLHRWFKQ